MQFTMMLFLLATYCCLLYVLAYDLPLYPLPFQRDLVYNPDKLMKGVDVFILLSLLYKDPSVAGRYPSFIPSSIYNEDSMKCAIAFQEMHNITASGIVDLETAKLLVQYFNLPDNIESINENDNQLDQSISHRQLDQETCRKLNFTKSSTIGMLFFVYERNHTILEEFTRQAENSAYTFKKYNPGLSIGIYTTKHNKLSFPFDFVGIIDDKDIPKGRQWSTRIQYMAKSPYEVTLAVDAGVLCCSENVFQLLIDYYCSFSHEYDIAFNSKYALNSLSPTSTKFLPHNFLILYKWNATIKHLFELWYILNNKHIHGDDQTTLYRSLQSLKLTSMQAKVGRIKNNFATAFVKANESISMPLRSTQLIAPGPVEIAHLRSSPSGHDSACTLYNNPKYVNKPRVMVDNNGLLTSSSRFPMGNYNLYTITNTHLLIRIYYLSSI